MVNPAQLIRFRGATYRLASTVQQDMEQGLGLSSEQTLELSQAVQLAASPSKVDAALELANTLLSGHGVEALRVPGAHVDNYYFDVVGLYVNMGDSYIATLLYDTEDRRFYVMDWGAFLELLEEKHPEYRAQD